MSQYPSNCGEKNQIRRGEIALVRAVIRNNTNQNLDELILTNRFATSLRPVNVSAAFPQAWAGDDLLFTLGTLAPGQEAIVEIEFEGVAPDDSAFSELTVTSVQGISTTERFDLQIAPFVPGDGNREEPGIGIPEDQQPGGQAPLGQPQTTPESGQPPEAQPTQPRTPGDQIGIPPEIGPGLEIDVQALNRTVNVGDLADIRFTVANRRQTTDEAVSISMLIPPGLELVSYDDSQWGLPLESKNADGTEFYFQQRNQMRPGEEMTFIARVRAKQSGTAVFEVQGSSAKSVGKIFGNDTIFVQ